MTIDNAEIQRIVRDYYKQPYANKMDNLEEMGKFFKKYNLPNWTREKQKVSIDPSEEQKSKLW